MKKVLGYGALLLVLAVAGYIGWFYLTLDSRTARPAAEALAALGSDGTVKVSDEPRWLTFEPASYPAEVGVVVYGGASCDVRGYAQVLRRVAAAGYKVVVPRMPVNYAILGQDKVLEVQAAFPGLKRWVLIGHSMGGGAGTAFVHEHPEALAGFIIWDSFPLESTRLDGWDKPVWHIHRATPDGQPPPSFTARRPLFPRDSVWVPLPGGIHMQFGAFEGGAYEEDWAATMSRAEQHDRVVQATLEALAAMGGPA